MAIELVCPSCKAVLLADEADLGMDITCTDCGKSVRVRRTSGIAAEPPRLPSRTDDLDSPDDEPEDKPSTRRRARANDDDDDRPRRRRSRRYDDDDYDDDLDPDVQPGTGMGSAALTLGILGILMSLCCPLIGVVLDILAIIFGVMGMKTEGRGSARAGLIMGIIGIILAIGNIILSVILHLNQAGGGPGGPPF